MSSRRLPACEQREIGLRGVRVLPAGVAGEALDRVVERGQHLVGGRPDRRGAPRRCSTRPGDLERDDVLVVLDEALVAGGHR